MSIGRSAAFGVMMALAANGTPVGTGGEPGALGRPIPVGPAMVAVIFPSSRLYPAYVADPRSPSFGILLGRYAPSDIAGVGRDRVGVRCGTAIGCLRLTRDPEAFTGFQADIEGGLHGHYEWAGGEGLDLGYDGYAGLGLTWRDRRRFGGRLRLYHDSSHLGDEYLEEVPRRRIEYTRNEARVGLFWDGWPGLTCYLEGGYELVGFNDEWIDPWSAQAGLQYASPPNRIGFGWYAAGDVSAFEEDDWRPNVTLQAGAHLPVGGGRRYRIGVELYDGRTQISELYMFDEQYAALGAWFDL